MGTSENEPTEALLASDASPRWVSDDEAGKFIVYVDNATIINAITVLADPTRFDVYKLLDLETFCEAFLLYDHARTLVGSSFMAGYSGGYAPAQGDDADGEEWWYEKPLDFAGAVWVSPEESEDHRRVREERLRSAEFTSGDVYAELLGAGLLRPVTLNAGTVHYTIENLSVLDQLARTLDIERLTRHVTDVFGDSIPWHYPSSEGSTPEAEAWRTLAIGQETWTSDSYPVYYFPKPVSQTRERGKDDFDWGWELNNNRQTDWVSLFVSQTFFYLLEATLHGKPFLCSSVRIPIVADAAVQMNRRFASFLHGALEAVDAERREKIEAIRRFLGDGAVRVVFLPALLFVLSECKSRKDVLPTLFAMRERPEILAFRDWCRRLEDALRNQDVDKLVAGIRQLDSLSRDLATSTAIDPVPGAIMQIPDLALLAQTPRGRDEFASRLVSASYNPTLVFLKDVATYVSDNSSTLQAIRETLEFDIGDKDLEILETIRARRALIYSEGAIHADARNIEIEHLEVTVGDRFENVQNSVIATRGSIAQGIISVRERGDSEIADALTKLDDLIANLSPADLTDEEREEAANLLKGITDEAAKPERNRTTLKTLADSLRSVLQTVAPIADAAGKAILALAPLWA